ncbi:TPR repeat [Crocosphaera chwakensis CCY0110]|uniref:TPR repeat n=1 Tax=Crocosphaera chwakensis CCY0110 TaxID=391612 RepID=A3IZJ1_9CHRO|nr:TPR repeat [Crocosphaera chwakensis CCY0110]
MAGSPVGQNLFFDTIDPLLRDFLSFLLSQPVVSQEALAETIEIIRLNQLAELDNFFGDICQIEFDSPITQEAEDVLIYTLLLPENSYEIMKFSDGFYQLVELGITGDCLKKAVLDWRKNLTDAFYGNYRPGSKNLYEILIKPIKIELELRNIKHIVFVQDSLLRNIPMSGLFNKDSQQYLIENYLISYSLDLGGSLLTTQPKNALILGSSEPTSTFPNALPGVLQETKLIQELIGGTRLINKSFTPKALENNLAQKDYEILHLASHSRFSGLSEEVKIQTGTEVLNLFEFDNLLNQRKASIKHLSLSACETASGSRYATLGVAGIGLRAGISSVLGSLWLADDKNSVEFFLSFYQSWLENNSVAKALQHAQKEQIEKNINPTNWANYILIS